ncbi:MAG: glycosyltransferase, partial [Okeania sp. SIO3C4]|nr:glycosyltransferase [Okeania sp. SIO3C4]
LKSRLRAKLVGYNLDEDRAITLEKVKNRADVKEVLQLADVYLDTYPSSSILSLVESLEMGLPVVVMEGKLARSQICSSLLRELEMHDLITESESAYIKLAVSLGTNAELRKQTNDLLKEKFAGKPSFLNSRSYGTKMGALFQKLFQNYLADALSESLRLRKINFIIFPDWSQSEEELYNDFAKVLTAIASHPEKAQITLLVDTSKISEEDADMALSSMVMNLMMEEELDVEEGPDISIIAELSQIQWEALLSRVQGKISFKYENEEAIPKINLEELTIYEVHNLLITRK